jgi:hypothetical protein
LVSVSCQVASEENKGLYRRRSWTRAEERGKKNFEKEILKIGSAIGNTFKKITEKGSEKPSDQKPTK